ncbi:hypothetical protein SAMN05421788_101542 [Filimonas lacunae]|uniref:Uncharacterized protein n=1 Tax=Filimonas lacunae TaxID=477680 RepID=A0A173MN65_9BACT|nr:hypothetical protein [Filimonas lacunae]BAV09095.1 hypothetical protein FLA_5143 [Filimonas lacunae]SIS67232.1 hypothetical protein SAMN05421788_101542 [Filimonas lacunae]
MKILILIAVLIFTAFVPVMAQQKPDSRKENGQKADSQQVRKVCLLINRIFSLSAEQQTALFNGQLKIAEQKRYVFSQFWKTPEFSSKMLEVNRSRDSLYYTVLGENQYRMYKDSVWVLQERGKRPDSTILQKNRP